MKNLINRHAWFLSLLLCATTVSAQQTTAKPALVLWEGVAVAGYVNHGAFVNFGGPTIKFVRKPWSLGFGILPTMRIKEDKVDKDAKKNSVVTPTAGFGFTFIYRKLVVQVPFYYNPKTTTANGKWHPGVGVGFKL